MTCYEAIGNSIGRFLKVDESTSFMGHSTITCFLVDVGLSLPLHGEVVLMVGNQPWSQPMDYEGIPFHCHCYFSTGHLALACSLGHQKRPATWWKNAIDDHLTVLDLVSLMDASS